MTPEHKAILDKVSAENSAKICAKDALLFGAVGLALGMSAYAVSSSIASKSGVKVFTPVTSKYFLL